MKQIALVLLSLFIMTSCSQVVDSSDKTTSPNILFIYTDDQAPWALGYSGNEQAITPNMDKLASEGMYFPNAYTTTPVCSPSRAGLLTSRYGYEVDIDDWINTTHKSLTRKEPKLGLNPDLVTWPSILQKKGYHTGLVGKWHLGYLNQHHPTHYGYDEFHGFIAGGTTTKDPILESNGVEKKYQGLTADILTDQAIDFLTRQKDGKFSLSLNYRAPHTYWLPVAPEDAAPYENIDIKLPHPDYPNLDKPRAKKMMKDYLSSVRSVDRNLGRLMAQLDKLGLRENTLVVFTSDHGYNMAHNGMWHKGNGHWLLKNDTQGTKNIPSNQRPNMYDNSIKVPMIVSWPKHIPQGAKNVTSFSNLDWYPTLLSLVEAKPDANTLLRGTDKSTAFFNSNAVLSTDYYAAYSTLHQSVSGMRMYSDGKYKLMKDFVNKGRDEFYDLSNDPEETTNLINTIEPKLLKVIAQLDDKMFNNMLKTNDPLTKPFFSGKKHSSHKSTPPNYEQVTQSDFSKQLYKGQRILERDNWNIWGASPIVDEKGKYHLFYSRWRGDHGAWLTHSEIAHAVADQPEGPYTPLGTVLSGRGGEHWDADTIHNPTIQKVGDQYALFYIGNNLARASDYDGHHASTQRIGLALSDHIYGPYKRVQNDPILDISKNSKDWDSYLTTNPALLQHPNGEYWLYYKAWDKYNDNMRKMGVAIADNIEGPYKKHEKNPLVSFSYLKKQVEDAYIFQHDGKFQMIMRDMGVIHPHVGLLLESDDGINWGEPLLGYKTNTDYTHETTIERMERPQVLMQSGKPTHLFLALMGGKANTSTAFVVPINNAQSK
ncbi:sulfatase-like hydrolase/transferase [Algibacillus agarilyticus]|uniref:sulfatase-like hydrolase/transferase n=1 Tax=Algibacillus agarilyticus TaxID=2234133 RepID=UPI0018E4E54F|nr:sulfatase-like hydrolase/transferase [Algibacillus agarilyticus]